jgi:hypothetical protein
MSGFYCSKLFEQLTVCGLHLQLRTLSILFILVVNPPIPMAAQSKAYVCGRSNAGVAGSNPFSAWMFFSCVLVCCAGSSPCDELTTRSEESYRVCVRVRACDLETSTVRRPRSDLVGCTTNISYTSGNTSSKFLYPRAVTYICYNFKGRRVKNTKNVVV